MSAATDLRPRAHGRRVSTAPGSRRGALLTALALWGTAAILAINSNAVIALEAKFTAFIMGLFTYGGSTSHDHLIYIGIGTGEVLGFLITPLCTSLVLASPVLILAGLLLLFPRYRVSWVLRGTLIALPLAIGANIVRFVLVGVALQLWGRTGFDIMHHYVGSVLVLLCSAGALVLLLLIATTGRVSIPKSWLAALGRRA